MAFATLTLARLFHGLGCRSKQPLMKIGFTTNKWSLAALGAGVVLLALVLFVPFLSKVFLVSSLTGIQLGSILGLALLPSVVIQIIKMITCRKEKDSFGK